MQDEKDRNAPDLSKAPTERYWDWLLHEDNLFSGRINFFLVAESMLIVAFATNAYADPDLTKILGAAGILFASLWCYVSICQIFFVINPMKQQLRNKLPEYREPRYTWLIVDPNIWLGILFPLFIVGIWIFLIIQE